MIFHLVRIVLSRGELSSSLNNGIEPPNSFHQNYSMGNYLNRCETLEFNYFFRSHSTIPNICQMPLAKRLKNHSIFFQKFCNALVSPTL